MLYKIADTIIEVSHLFDYSKNLMKDYVVSCGTPAIRIALELSEVNELAKADNSTPEISESLAILRRLATHLTASGKGLLFHSSAVFVGGSAVLFSAPSGTGKSTHARMWRETFPDVRYVNDDKPFVRTQGDEIYIYGSPWRGKHNLGENVKVKVKAICFIERGENCKIEKMSKYRAIPLLLNQTLRPKEGENLDKCLTLIESILNNVDIYKLTVNISHEGAILARKTILGDI